MKSLKSEKRRLDFFMGANAPLGFVSLYDELKIPKEGFRSYLIKGGAGTGKSGILRKVSAAAEAEPLLEYLHCSSDPNSLDGIILHSAKCSMVDATQPHVIEPTYPGSYETVVNLCEYFDEGKMAPRLSKTVELQKENNSCHEKCRRFLRCADILLRDNTLTAEACTDFEKLDRFSSRLAKRLITTANSDEAHTKKIGTENIGTENIGTEKIGTKKIGIEHKRLLSAVTNQGVVFYSNTITELCDRVWLFDDPWGVAAPHILEYIKEYAQEAGHDIFCCYCPLSPGGRIEHILIPSLGLGFITQNAFIKYPSVPQKIIHAERFTDMDKLNLKRQALRFNRKAAAAMIDAAVAVLKGAKRVHDELERQYTDAVDFKAVNEKSDALVKAIIARI